MDVSTVALALSTALSTAALVAAAFAWRHARQLTRWQSWPFEVIVRIEATLDEHAVQLTQHHDRLRKINARLAARDRRSGAPGELEPEIPGGANSISPDDPARQPGEDEVSFKRRIRLLIAQGKLGHG